MARVYAEVNQQMPRAYWDYDSVNITWGVLENYEVVRKIGEPCKHLAHVEILNALLYRSRKVLRSLRGHQCCELSEMRYQGSEAGKEEEDKERDQDSAEPFRWS